MAKNTIGQFIVALRKANGMTQQDVADRLNVSNKAVSRWERDECAPDLSVIPALAEMFGVTCDELLKGERIPESMQPERKVQKVEKQVRHLVNRTLTGFKTLIWISLAVAAVGLVLMFGISYGFYRPVIGLAVMLLFEVCAAAIVILDVSRTKDVKTDNELFEMADRALAEKFNAVLGSMSFMAFLAILAALLLSLPLLLTGAALPLFSYYFVCLVYIALLLVFIYLKYKKAYIAWIISGEKPAKRLESGEKIKKNMTRTQLALCCAAGLLFVFGPYLDTREEGFSLYSVAVILALVCFTANIACFVICLIRNEDHRKALIIPGIRNAGMILPVLLLFHVHTVSWRFVRLRIVTAEDGSMVQKPIYEPYDTWHTGLVWYAAGAALAVYLIFGIIDMAIKRKAKRA